MNHQHSQERNRLSGFRASSSQYENAAAELIGISNPQTSGNNNNGDDQYAFLANFDTVLLVDDSGSMAGGRWNETAKALAALVGLVTHYDDDGVDLHFLNASGRNNMKKPREIMSLFQATQPQGRTPIGGALKKILAPYIEKFTQNSGACKPLNIIVITDGEPTDDPDTVIEQYAKKLDELKAEPKHVGIQFVQIGNDQKATEYLKYLDDNLHELCKTRDMVDTVPWMGESGSEWLLKATLGAITRRYDRKVL